MLEELDLIGRINLTSKGAGWGRKAVAVEDADVSGGDDMEGVGRHHIMLQAHGAFRMTGGRGFYRVGVTLCAKTFEPLVMQALGPEDVESLCAKCTKMGLVAQW